MLPFLLIIHSTLELAADAVCVLGKVYQGKVAIARMDQAPKDGGLGAQASFDSLNGDSDDDAFSEVTGISRRSVSGWGSFANLQGAERNVSRFFRRFIPSHTTAQTGTLLVEPQRLAVVSLKCLQRA